MTDAKADRYSHTPRRIFDKAIDRQDVKRQHLHGMVRVLKDEVSTLKSEVALMRATLTAIHDRLFVDQK